MSIFNKYQPPFFLKDCWVKNKKKNDQIRHITHRSNVIQFDNMGYPLRLVIMSDNEQIWLDTYEEDGDVVLKWNKH